MTTDTPQQQLDAQLKDIRFAMLTTRAPDGSLHSRPMTTQASDAEGALWFFSARQGHATLDIRRDPQINLSYSDPASQRYVSISGHAAVVEDRARIRALWRPEYVTWFPQGVADPDIVLLQVAVDRAEYWPSPATWVGRTLAFAKALVTGEAPTTSPRGPVSLPGQAARAGAVNWTVLLWALGVPLPIVLLVMLFRGCS